MMRELPMVAAGVMLMAFPAACQGQGPDAPRRLASPDAVEAEGFTDVAGLRELSDGRVLLVDPQERRIMLLDSDLARESEVGRQGQGPGEFLLPVRLFALQGDSSAVIDRSNGRILLLDGGALAATIDLGTSPDCAARPPRITSIDGSDRQGNLYFTLATPETISILRWRPGSCADQAEVAGSMPGRGGQGAGGGVVFGGEIPPPLGPEPAWTVGADGRVAVVHPEPFRVVVVGADGRQQEGPTIEFDPLPLSEGHREAWRMAQNRSTLMTVASPDGPQFMYLPRDGNEPDSWLRVLPPFPANGARYAPDGTLWVERWVEAGAETAFDLIDPEGRVVERVLLPPERRLVAFGDGTLYAVFRDSLDLEYVERYRIR